MPRKRVRKTSRGENDILCYKNNPEPNIFPSDDTLTTVPSRNIVNIQQSSFMSSPSTRSVFSPEEIRPYPKAAPRKTTIKSRKIKKSAIYTDTPEKEAARNEYEERQKRQKAKRIKKKIFEQPIGKKGKDKAKKKKANTPPSSEKEEFYCLVCLGPYTDSRPGEKWV